MLSYLQPPTKRTAVVAVSRLMLSYLRPPTKRTAVVAVSRLHSVSVRLTASVNAVLCSSKPRTCRTQADATLADRTREDTHITNP